MPRFRCSLLASLAYNLWWSKLPEQGLWLKEAASSFQRASVTTEQPSREDLRQMDTELPVEAFMKVTCLIDARSIIEAEKLQAALFDHLRGADHSNWWFIGRMPVGQIGD